MTGVTMTFSEALKQLRVGSRVRRRSWQSGEWLSMTPQTVVEAANIWNPHNRAHAERCGGRVTVLAAITQKLSTGEIQMGWTPSQQDLFAEDWETL